MNARAAFGARLRRERERRGLSLDAIAAESKISASHFAALERGDLSRWPAGIFAIGFIRSYARAVGLDPVETTQELKRLLAAPDEAATVPAPEPSVAARPAPDSPLRLTLAADPSAHDADRPRWSLQTVRTMAAVAEVAALALVAAPAWLLWGWPRYWIALGVAAIVYHIATTTFLGRSWAIHLLARRMRVAVIDRAAATAPREKRRVPEPRPSPSPVHRRARRADRQRPQA